MKKKIKILVITDMYPLPKIDEQRGIFVKKRIKSLEQLCDLTAICPLLNSSKYRKIPKKIDEGFGPIYFPRCFDTPFLGRIIFTTFFWLFFLIRPIKGIKKKFDFDIIHCHMSAPPGFVGTILSFLLRKPIVITACGSDINEYPKHFFLKKIVKFALKKSDKIISVSKTLKKKIVEEFNIEKEKIDVIYNGVDQKLLDSKRLAKRKDDVKIITFVGNLVEIKGVDVLIKGFSRLEKKRNDVRLYLVGDGPLREKYKSLAQRLNIKNKVKFLGKLPQEKVFEILKKSDIFCLPSRNEGRSNSCLEALAAGVPVVASDINSNKEIVTQEHNGLLFEKNNPVSLAKALHETLEKNWDAKKIKNSIQEPSWTNHGLKTFALYKRILTNP